VKPAWPPAHAETGQQMTAHEFTRRVNGLARVMSRKEAAALVCATAFSRKIRELNDQESPHTQEANLQFAAVASAIAFEKAHHVNGTITPGSEAWLEVFRSAEYLLGYVQIAADAQQRIIDGGGAFTGEG